MHLGNSARNKLSDSISVYIYGTDNMSVVRTIRNLVSDCVYNPIHHSIEMLAHRLKTLR